MTTSAYILYDFQPWKSYGTSDDFPHDEAILTWEFLGQFTGWYSLTNRALEMGEWPLWNPYEHTGVPLLANYQSAIFYPPRVLHSLVDLHLASTLLILLKVWLCGFNAYLYARGIGLRRVSSRVLSFGWMLATYNMIWTYWCEVDVSAWFPVLLLGIEWILAERYRRGFFLIAFSAVLMLLAGHPETAFTMAFGAGFYFLIRLAIQWRAMRNPLRAPLVSLAAWGIALIVCAGQILPFLEYLQHSYTLAERAEQASAEHALSPLALVNFWVPRYFGITHTPTENYWGEWINSNFNTVIYPGIVIWLGALMLFTPLRGTTRKWRTIALCLLAPTGFSLLVVFDQPGVQFVKSIPILGSMWSIWWFAFPAFSIPLIAALGFEHAFSTERPLRDLVPTICTFVVATILCAGVYFGIHRSLHVFEGKGLERFVQLQLVIAGLIAVSALLAMAVCLLRKEKALQNILVAILLVDLLVAARGFRPTAPHDRIYPETALTTWIADHDPPVRCALGSASSATIPDGIMQYYGIEDFLGYDGIYPERIKTLRNHVKAWANIEPVYAIRYYLNLPALDLFVPEELRDDFQLVTTIDGLEVHENTRAWERVRLVGGAEVVANREEIFERLNDPAFDPERTVLLETEPGIALPTSSDTEPGTARFIARTMNTVMVEADAETPCMLVLSDQYFPGWNAYVNGARTEIFSAYYLFRAVPLPAGQHRIEFRYEPISFAIGIPISAAGMVASLAGALLVLRRTAIMRSAVRN